MVIFCAGVPQGLMSGAGVSDVADAFPAALQGAAGVEGSGGSRKRGRGGGQRKDAGKSCQGAPDGAVEEGTKRGCRTMSGDGLEDPAGMKTEEALEATTDGEVIEAGEAGAKLMKLASCF